MAGTRLRKFLDDAEVRYTSITHSPAYTSPEIAASAHVCGRELAKTVMIRIDGKLAMAVLSSTRWLDVERLGESLGAGHEVVRASEQHFADAFPDCEVGAMPPFGNLYEMEVFVDPSLAEDEQISFNAGTHAELIQMSFTDYRRLVKPRIVELVWGQVATN